MKYRALVKAIAALHQEAVGRAATAVNQTLVMRNWLIGSHIVEYQQHGSDRADYGEGLLRRLASDLQERKINGTSPDMLERMRLLYLVYSQIGPSISASVMRKSPNTLAANPLPISSPVGLLLCSSKDETKVEYATGGLDQKLFVSRYLVALPQPEELRKLLEADRGCFGPASKVLPACKRQPARKKGTAS